MTPTTHRESRANWILLGSILGFVAGMATMAAGILFVDERVTSALIVGIVTGATGWFLLTYDHGRRQASIDDTRKELTRLTALLERSDNQD